MQVEIRNFQSLEHVSFRISGFTTVVGRSNIGKSAIVRALSAALTGAVGTDFVRHGGTCARAKGKAKCDCFSSVSFTLADGTLTTWEKGDKVNRYTVTQQDGSVKVYDKPERGTPEHLSPLFDPIQVGDRKVLVNVADQWTPLFLVNESSGSAVADVLADVAQLDDLNVAMTMASKDRRSNQALLKTRESDLKQTRSNLESYASVPDLVEAMADLRVATAQKAEKTAQDLAKLEARFSSTRDQYQQLKELPLAVIKLVSIQTYQVTDRLVQKARPLIAELRLLKALPLEALPSDLKAPFTLLKTLSYWLQRKQEVGSALEALKPLEALKVPQPLTGTDNYFRLYKLYDRFYQIAFPLKHLRNLLTPLVIPSVPNLSKLRSLEVLAQRLERLKYRPLDLAPMPATAIKLPDGRLTTWLGSLERLKSDLKSLEADAAKAVKDLAEAQADLDSLGICVTCARPFSGEHAHA